MYRWLLCWRYLRTRYIALASIISVTLGVATMIVVNSVMMGFTHEMENRLHGILSDIIFQSRSLEGFPDPDWHMEQIRRVAGDEIEAMTPTVVVPGMLNYQVGDTWMTRPVQIIGIDEKTQGLVSDFSKYLQHPENRRQLSFQLREGGYDVIDHQADGPSLPREEMSLAGWEHRRRMARMKKMLLEIERSENGRIKSARIAPRGFAGSVRPGRSPGISTAVRSRKIAIHRGHSGDWVGKFPSGRAGPLSPPTGRRCQTHASHRGNSPQNRQRHVHHRGHL